MLNL
ncbi:hypothetical protein Patl1_35217 [Pistacia atlantica]|jgi:D-arabinose 1-dehydrogenase-like Zn-dependent alcohol dehydrogenase